MCSSDLKSNRSVQGKELQFQQFLSTLFKINPEDFPGGAVVESPSACQCRGHGFEPWSGKIPHAAEQLGPCATAAEPVCLELVLCSKRGHCSERPVHRNGEWSPLATTREGPCAATKTQRSQK